MQHMSITEACKIVGISRAMMYKLIRNKKSPKIIKIGKRSLISANELQNWLQNLAK